MSEGRVKRKEYLMFLLGVRKEEKQARDLGLKVETKPIEDIRAEFEEQFGSIYMEM